MIIVKSLNLCAHRGCDVTLQTLSDDHAKYCVLFAGNDKHFQTLDEAKAYITKREFYTGDIDSLLEREGYQC